MTEDTKFWLQLGATFFGGGILGWVIAKLEAWWRRPRVVIEYGDGYPFIDTATFTSGGTGDFVRVLVKNEGRSTAQRCKCYVKSVNLRTGGHVVELPTASLMLTLWVPREAKTTTKNLPPHSEFFADVAFAHQELGRPLVEAVFEMQNANVAAFANHVGDFELEFVVLAENLPPVSRVIQFSFDGKSTNLVASS